MGHSDRARYPYMRRGGGKHVRAVLPFIGIVGGHGEAGPGAGARQLVALPDEELAGVAGILTRYPRDGAGAVREAPGPVSVGRCADEGRL